MRDPGINTKPAEKVLERLEQNLERAIASTNVFDRLRDFEFYEDM